MRCVLRAITIAMLFGGTANAQEPWTTFRGNPQRSGNTDGVTGPTEMPKVLWSVKSQYNFIASPVPMKDQLLLSAIAGFNRPNLSAFPLVAKGAMAEPLWEKSSPYLKLPTVSSPAVSKGQIFFGDGMHQTDGAILHCLTADGTIPLWQLNVPGRLVHLEGSPCVVGDQLYIGGGNAGVLCVKPGEVTLDGKALDLAAIEPLMQSKWKELQAAYAVQKKKDPDFAVPPSEDQLPKPTPKLLWQQGANKWHVDAPVNATKERVFVTSAFLDKEKEGDRALFALDAKTGTQLWRAPIALNPWSGVSLTEDAVILATSSINYDYKSIKGAKGEIMALSQADGKVRWKKDVPGGVLGCVAIAQDLAICAATDGKVRAYGIKDGERRWIYDAKMPLFAPPAVTGEVIYVGDLKGTIHAIDRKSGAAKWVFDLGAAPLSSPGMIYGGIVVQGGKLYVATSNLDGPFAGKGTIVVCLGNP